MKRILVILVFSLHVPICRSQGLNIDSLKNELSRAKEDTARVLLLAQLAETYVRYNRDSGLMYALQGYHLAQKINYKRGEHFCVARLARCWWSVGDYATAIKVLLPKLKEIEATGDFSIVGYAYGTISDSYRDQGDYDQALVYYFKVAEPQNKSCVYCWIRNAVVASIYLGKGMLDSAQYYSRKGFTYPPMQGLEGWPLYIRGKICAGFKKYDSAFFYYRQSIPHLEKEYNLKDLASVFNSMAALFRSVGPKDSALFYAHRALTVALPRKFAKEAMEAYLQLSSVYETVNTDSALHYYKQAIVARDSLYNQEKQRQILSFRFSEEMQKREAENAEQQYRSQVKIYSLLAAMAVFLVIGILLWRNNQHRKKAYALLQKQKSETEQQKAKAEQALEDLKATQVQLIQREKMASLGELTAGIAHEIQNPLNFINNFSEINNELIEEMNGENDIAQLKAIAAEIRQNNEKIAQHGKRTDAIVKGMLQHSRTSSGEKQPTNINALADEYLRLSYQAMRSRDQSFQTAIRTQFDESLPNSNVVPQEIGRVLLNLFNNAFYAVNEKRKHSDDSYEPTVLVSTKNNGKNLEIKVEDNGTGIPQNAVDKIFQPFFTTKPTGEGTGLGLSLSYDIITKGHGGEIKVETKEGEGSEFVIQVPIV